MHLSSALLALACVITIAESRHIITCSPRQQRFCANLPATSPASAVQCEHEWNSVEHQEWVTCSILFTTQDAAKRCVDWCGEEGDGGELLNENNRSVCHCYGGDEE